MAPRCQHPQRRIDAALRDPQPPERKRDLPIDPFSIEANRPAKIPTCYSNRPPCATLMHQLLRIKLHNSSNACYINAALLGQHWATLAYEGFDPELWDQWRFPLLELLNTSVVGIYVLQFLFRSCCNPGLKNMHPMNNRVQRNFWAGSGVNNSVAIPGDRNIMAGSLD